MSRHIPFERLHNFRDLGGYTTADGRTVRWGRLFRSDSLGKLTGEEWERFLALGVGTVIDLRYPWEIDAKGRVPEHPTFTYHNLSIEHRPYDQAGLGPDVETGPFLAEKYLEVAHDGVEELRQVVEVIATFATSTDESLVFHCASGKDRTGLVAALVLALLGVPESEIIEDFALTELATERLLADWRDDHPGQEPSWPGYGRAPADVMRLFLSALTHQHGSMAEYARDLLKIDECLIAALRRNLLEPAEEPEWPSGARTTEICRNSSAFGTAPPAGRSHAGSTSGSRGNSARITSGHGWPTARSGSPRSAPPARPPVPGNCGGTIPQPGAHSPRAPGTCTG
ncbi:tyrosine-protein phosphatase [Streptomyces avermitilis]|uniref:tyrosine-protein phosphatase n=1 Tax=Streptomyces avermitilis TaxID=33903 RepID=UPI0033BD5CB4